MNVLKLSVLLLLVVIISTVESKRKRPPPPPEDEHVKKNQQGRLSNLLRRVKHRHHQRPSESKKVYYYSMPPKNTPRPRVILGDELNFIDLGILKNSTSTKQTNSSSSSLKQSSSQNHEIRSSHVFDPYGHRFHDNLFHTSDDYPQPPFKKRPRGPPRGRNPRRRPRGRGRGPGYRREPGNPWQNHYVIHDFDEQLDVQPLNEPRPKPPKVMDSMKRAANEMRNAYKAAVFQSAKMAKYTGNAAVNYMKGVRNLIGGNNDYRKQDTGSSTTAVIRIPEDLDKMKLNGEIEEVQDVQASENGSGPNVYLDWGGSFWRLFYNKSGNGKV